MLGGCSEGFLTDVRFYLGSVLVVRQAQHCTKKKKIKEVQTSLSPCAFYCRMGMHTKQGRRAGSAADSATHPPSTVLKQSTEIPLRLPGDASAYTREKVLLNSL